MRNDNMECFLTYADNNAVGYFAKQGFTKEITFDRERVRAHPPAADTAFDLCCADQQDGIWIRMAIGFSTAHHVVSRTEAIAASSESIVFARQRGSPAVHSSRAKAFSQGLSLKMPSSF